MNKYQKKKSRLIKTYVRLYKAAGHDITYKQMKVQYRNVLRATARLNKNFKNACKSFRRFSYNITKVGAAICKELNKEVQ